MSDAERTIEHLLTERPWQTYASLKQAVPSIRRSTLETLATTGRINKHNPGSHMAMLYGPRGAAPPKIGQVVEPTRNSRYNALNTGWTGVVVAALNNNPGWHRGPDLKVLTGYEWAAVTANNLAKEGRALCHVCADGRKAFAALGTTVPKPEGLPLRPTQAPPPPPEPDTSPVATAPDLATLAAALTEAERALQQALDARDAARRALIAAARGAQ